ncbi:MAG: hypothetical protein HGA39_06585 [Coriobacteriia bacterium]|nr:hypothetical protein [Coriobacteriia bacterium]
MRTLMRIVGALVVVVVITGAVYFVLQSLPTSLAAGRGSGGAISAGSADERASLGIAEGQTSDAAVADGTRTLPSGARSGGTELHGGKGGASLVQGLSQILLTLVKISIIASVVGIAAAFAATRARRAVRTGVV